MKKLQQSQSPLLDGPDELDKFCPEPSQSFEFPGRKRKYQIATTWKWKGQPFLAIDRVPEGEWVVTDVKVKKLPNQFPVATVTAYPSKASAKRLTPKRK